MKSKDHERMPRQTGNVSTALVIAENANVHRDEPALYTNDKNEANVISLLTTHFRDIGRHVEVSRGDANALIVCA